MGGTTWATHHCGSRAHHGPVDAQTELGTLLRTWRARIGPADVGFPSGSASRRTPGLRREEVALLAGVSSDYVQRLEQGRAHPSPTVLRSLARALRLTESEYEAASDLAGHASRVRGTVPRHIGPSVLRLLDRLGDVPIGVFDATWTLLDHNDLWAALMGETRTAGRSANLIWQYFSGEPHRVQHRHPREFERSLVSDLRSTAARYPDDRSLRDLVRGLRASSPPFRESWDSAEVAPITGERKTVIHPQVGSLDLDCDVLSVHGADLRIIVFTAPGGSEAVDTLSFLRVLGTQDMSERRRDPSDRT